VLRIYGPERERMWREAGKDPTIRTFVTCTLHQILPGRSSAGALRWARHVSRMGEIRNAYKILYRKTQNKETKRETNAYVGR
jgi:hypothetical protein